MALEPVDTTTDDAQTYKGQDIDSDGDGTVDSADDASTLQGNSPSAFADSGHGHPTSDISNFNSDAQSAVDGSSLSALGLGTRLTVPVFASKSDVPSQPEGSVVYISGDGLYVEDGT